MSNCPIIQAIYQLTSDKMHGCIHACDGYCRAEGSQWMLTSFGRTQSRLAGTQGHALYSTSHDCTTTNNDDDAHAQGSSCNNEASRQRQPTAQSPPQEPAAGEA